MRKILAGFAAAGALLVSGCTGDANVVSQNIATDADNFKINRRVIFYNGITNEYIMTIEGKCSLGVSDRKLDVTCKVGENSYKVHKLGLSDNVTWFAEQIDGANVSADHYKVVFKPSVIIPEVEIR